MNYTQEERLDIGRRICNNEITRYEAAEEYGISDQTARTYCNATIGLQTGVKMHVILGVHLPCLLTWRGLRQ